MVTGGGPGIGRAASVAYSRKAHGWSPPMSTLKAARRRSNRSKKAAARPSWSTPMSPATPAPRQWWPRRSRDSADWTALLTTPAFPGGGDCNLTADYTRDDLDRVIGVNLTGVWLSMKAEIPQMLAQGGGAIVNTASIKGLIATPGSVAYMAAKHGVVGLTNAAATSTRCCSNRSSPTRTAKSRSFPATPSAG